MIKVFIKYNKWQEVSYDTFDWVNYSKVLNVFELTDLNQYEHITHIQILTQKNMKDKTILEEAQEVVYGNRELDYGSATDNLTLTARGWSIIARKKISPKQVSLMMIWLKMAREMHKEKRDNLVDIAGYAACLEKLEKGL